MLSLLMLFAGVAQPNPVATLHVTQSAPGHFAAPRTGENAATLARNAALITRLDQAVHRGSRRIAALVDKIEQANVARGAEPSPPSPPPPPPPYMELATIAQQTGHITRLRDELVRQQRVVPRLERTLRQLRSR